MDPFVEWQLKTYARLFEISPEIIERLESAVNDVMSSDMPAKIAPPRIPHPRSEKPHRREEPRQPEGKLESIDKVDKGPSVRVTSPYGERTHPVSGKKRKHHNGIDLGMATGEKVYSIDDGVVKWSHKDKTSGNYVTIITKGDLSVSYAHLDKRLVQKGQRVKKNQVIGLVGSTGRVTGSHLHLIVREKTKKGRWKDRAPTEAEVRRAIGGRDLNWGRHKEHRHASWSQFPLSKQAFQISIEPWNTLVNQELTNMTSKLGSDYFSYMDESGQSQQVNKIVLESGDPGHFGMVRNDEPGTIYVSLDKIQAALANTDPEQAGASIREVLSHEMGHFKNKFQGGEAPAHAESNRVEPFFQ